MKKSYESPKMFAEMFVANQYVAACEEAFENIPVMEVKCESAGHENTAVNLMFTDSNSACLAKYNPGVGDVGSDGRFHTQFEACATKVGCNRHNWEDVHWDTTFITGRKYHPSYFIMHDTSIDLSTAEKYQLS